MTHNIIIWTYLGLHVKAWTSRFSNRFEPKYWMKYAIYLVSIRFWIMDDT